MSSQDRGIPEIPEDARFLLDRKGMERIGVLPSEQAMQSIRNSLPTLQLALRCFEEAAALSGSSGWVDPAGGTPRRLLCRYDSDGLLIPFPVMALLRGRAVPVVGAMFRLGNGPPAHGSPKPDAGSDAGVSRADPARFQPRSALAEPGQITFSEGPSHFGLEYGPAGELACTNIAGGDAFTQGFLGHTEPFAVDNLARPPCVRPVSLLLRGDLSRDGHPVEALARMALDLDPGRATPLRAIVPAEVPYNVLQMTESALRGARRALVANPLSGAGWLAVDGYEGCAIAFAPTADEAVSRCRDQMNGKQPLPPALRTKAPESLEAYRLRKSMESAPRAPGVRKSADGKTARVDLGTISISRAAPESDESKMWEPPVPETTPIILCPVGPAPEAPQALAAAGFVRRLDILDRFGHIRHGWVREDSNGWTMVGHGIADAVVPGSIDQEIATAFKEYEDLEKDFEIEPPTSVPSFPWTTLHLVVWDSSRRRRCPATLVQSSRGLGPSIESLDTEHAAWRVVVARRR